MLKEKCQMTDQEWEERQKTRQLEMEAVSKALAILSSDDAHDTFTRTFNPALLQMESSSKKSLRSQAAELLKKKEDEIKHKDFCVDDFNTNQLETEKKDREKSDLTAKIEDLKMTIETLTKEIEALKAEIAEMQLQLKRAGEDREVENKEFQLTVADQRATQKLLQQALTVLKGFYEKGAAAALIQKAEPAGPPPPPGFKEYKTSAAAGAVMGMIQQIINDAKAMEAETIRAEEDAQKAYEDFVKETNASIEAASKAIVNKSENKAKAEAELVETKESKEAT